MAGSGRYITKWIGPAKSRPPPVSDKPLGNDDEQAGIVRLPPAPLTWAERLRRVFGIEITVCPHCGGRLRVIADVTDPMVIEGILEYVRREGLPRAPSMRGDLAWGTSTSYRIPHQVGG